MNENDKPQTVKEVCTIQIGFPVESDEQAISYKRKISEILTDIPQVRIEFSLMSVPTRIPNNAR